MNEKNIFQRMSDITVELAPVAKALFVETGKNRDGSKNGYRAVSERDIIDAVKPIEAKHGVYSYPADREMIMQEMLESENEYNGKVTKKTTFFSRIKTTYRFVNVDDPLDYLDTVTYAEGIDTQDKGSGKAMTYADKYALMKAYKISTGDDPDATPSADEDYSRMNTAPQNKTAQSANYAPQTPNAQQSNVALICSSCGKEIDQRVFDFSVQRYKRSLCRDCQRKETR